MAKINLTHQSACVESTAGPLLDIGPLNVVHPGDVARDFVVGVRKVRHGR